MADRHNTDDLSEILDKIDMAGYLDREGIHYSEKHGRSGPQLNVKVCPLCGNSDWKVYLNAETGVGNCFAGSHPEDKRIFTKWRFIQAHLGTTGRATVEHVKQVARDLGWQAPKRHSVAVKSEPVAWELPVSIPIEAGRNLPYLANRGISGELAAYFHLRYAPDGSYFRFKVNGDWEFRDFSRRIIIPVYDLDGTLVTFQGRDVTGTKEKKYLFPPGLFGSGTFLYNGHNALVGSKRVVMGEGAFDVAAIKIAFDQEPALRDVVPVGTFGKHLSFGTDNCQLLKFKKLKEQGLEEVTIMWDGEVLATDAALESARLLKDIGLRVRIAMLPADKDPNEVTAAVVRKAFYEAVLFDWTSALHVRMLRRTLNGISQG